jgi:hypothetical protein
MQPEPIVLIPPTHEQSTPSFHVEDALFEPFIEFLESRGVRIAEEPEVLGRMGPHGSPLHEIEVEAGTPLPRLESLQREFLREPRA